jgi:hypothetical protein
MISIPLICLLLALVCFVVSAVGVATRVNLQSLGLAFWVLAVLLGGKLIAP